MSFAQIQTKPMPARFSKYPAAWHSAVCARGFSLVELMVSVAIGLGLLLAVGAMYSGSKKMYSFQENAGHMQEDAIYALDSIARDLRMAGYAGCRGIATEVDGSTTTHYPALNWAPGTLGGFDGPNPLATLAAFSKNDAITRQPLSTQNFIRGFDSFQSGVFGGVANDPIGDSLYFSGASANSVAVTAAMADPTSPLTIASNAADWGIGVYSFVVSDCNYSALFKGKLSGSTQIVHTTAEGNNSNNFSTNYKFGTDAIVMPVEWNFYYVGAPAGSDTRSLYRVYFNGNTRLASQEVVSNVEALRLHYAENTTGVNNTTSPSTPCTLSPTDVNCEPNRTADVWRTSAGAVTDWSHVVAVRIGLMMVSDEDGVNTDVVATPLTLLGETYTLPIGASTNRLRKEFSTTVVLRN